VSAVKLDQAFVQHFIDGDFGLPIAHENIAYQPVNGTAYAELRMLQNDITMLDLAHTNITDGVFRIVLRYPTGTSSIAAKTKADNIFAHFGLGSQVEFDGQAATIESHQRQPGVAESGWYVLVLTLGYRAKLQRV
jgi:hypothetical protein